MISATPEANAGHRHDGPGIDPIRGQLRQSVATEGVIPDATDDRDRCPGAGGGDGLIRALAATMDGKS